MIFLSLTTQTTRRKLRHILPNCFIHLTEGINPDYYFSVCWVFYKSVCQFPLRVAVVIVIRVLATQVMMNKPQCWFLCQNLSEVLF